jgi:hypothetical protein
MSGQIICEKHYFGPKCNIFCVNKNNGTCNGYGELVCNTNFFGNECSIHCVDTDHGNCSTDGFLQCESGKYGWQLFTLSMSIHFRNVNVTYSISHDARYCTTYTAYILHLVFSYTLQFFLQF